MIATLLSLAVLAAPAPADTVLELRRGDRVVIQNLLGEISVGTWDSDRLELRSLDDDLGVVVRRVGRRVEVSRDGRRRGVELSVRVPAWVDMEITGRQLDVDARGITGSLRIENVEGDVTVAETRGPVTIHSLQGSVTVTDAAGRVEASSRGDDVRLVRVTGDVEADSGDGDIEMQDVVADNVRAETQDGDIVFSGDVRPGGSYGFFVHDGDATIAVPERAGVRVTVSTFDGEFESEFPITIQRFTGGREFDFTLGDGGARLQIEVFDGEIRLLRRR